MAKWKEGERVRVITRPVTAEDRRSNLYFEHMAGLVGQIANIYGPDEIVVEVEPDSVSKISLEVHGEAIKRLRGNILEKLSEEAKSKFTQEELNFTGHYVILARGEDLEKA